jgi:hypothetical protein
VFVPGVASVCCAQQMPAVGGKVCAVEVSAFAPRIVAVALLRLAHAVGDEHDAAQVVCVQVFEFGGFENRVCFPLARLTEFFN